jgi:hypothetical protein
VIVVLVLVSAEVAGSIVEGVNLVIHGYILWQVEPGFLPPRQAGKFPAQKVIVVLASDEGVSGYRTFWSVTLFMKCYAIHML